MQSTGCHSQGAVALGREGSGGDLADWMTNKEAKAEADVPGATVASKLPAWEL